MKKKKLFIAITLSNYLIDRTGTPKVVMSHQVAANDAGIKYVALFPIGGSSKYAKRLFSNSFGVICDGKFAGVFSLEAFLARVRRLLDGEYELGCIYIHHFMGWNLESIAGIVSSYPKVQLVVYAHDYYLCCTNYNLIQDSTQLCGSARLGDAQCVGCAYYADSIIREDCIWRLLHNELHRIVFACPSSVVERMVQSFHPEAKGHCTVIPHQRYVGIYLDNKEMLPPNHAIKVAYLGKQQSIKGWDCWCRLVDAFRGQGKYEFVVFNNETKPLPSGMRRVFVEFSPGKPNAMIDELRRENVDVALLWSQCLETYSYTCMEAYASNAFIITCPSSGNIAEFVSMTHCGQVLSSEQELCQLLDEPDKLLELLNGFRANHDGGAMALATNDAFIALAKPSMPTAQNAVENERQCRTYRFRLDNCISLPLRIFYSCRERKKIEAANSRKRKQEFAI